MHKYLWCTILILIVSCSSEKPAGVGGQRPSEVGKSSSGAPYSLEIIPVDAARNSTLFLTSKGFNLSDAKVEWLVNESPAISSPSEQFKLSDTKKGDKVQVKAIMQEKEIFSNTILVKNAPPEISKIKFIPEVFKPGDILGVDVTGKDIDNDKITYIYEWTKNKEPAGSDKQIGAPIKRGDKISVRITPFDSEAYGKPITLEREIKNVSPIINEHTNFKFDGKTYTYQVNATDPDEDILTYSLKSAPAGMTINPKTGLIQWNVPEEFKGKAVFIVSATDGHGGESTQNLAFEIKSDKK
jgi:hypothetical protein